MIAVSERQTRVQVEAKRMVAQGRDVVYDPKARFPDGKGFHLPGNRLCQHGCWVQILERV
jgi:hypothetical protein